LDKIITACWEEVPYDRPNFIDIVTLLEALDCGNPIRPKPWSKKDLKNIVTSHNSTRTVRHDSELNIQNTFDE